MGFLDSIERGLEKAVNGAFAKTFRSGVEPVEIASALKRHKLRRGRTVIGRGSDADITVDDAGASRKHAEIIWDGTRAQVSDLGSTNGTTLNGRALKSALLEPDSIIDIGATRIVYRVLAQSKEQRP